MQTTAILLGLVVLNALLGYVAIRVTRRSGRKPDGGKPEGPIYGLDLPPDPRANPSSPSWRTSRRGTPADPEDIEWVVKRFIEDLEKQFDDDK